MSNQMDTKTVTEKRSRGGRAALRSLCGVRAPPLGEGRRLLGRREEGGACVC